MEDAWNKLLASIYRQHKSITSTPTLLQRAQVAAVLGNDKSNGIRQRLEQRNTQTRTRPHTRGLLVSATAAAAAVLLHPGVKDLAFFRAPPLSLAFEKEDEMVFNEVVNG